MINLFEGLEKFGFFDVSGDIFKKQTAGTDASSSNAVKEIDINEYLFSKTYTCICCSRDFTNRTIRQGKVRLITTDTDLMSHYEPFEPLIYDVVLCPHCGYAAITQSFSRLSEKQSELILQNITPKYKHTDYPDVFNVDIAIERYKLALLCAVTRKATNGEKSYLCMKLAWLHRMKEDSQTEMAFINNALTGFKIAYSNERFPICGLDEITVSYIVGELSRRVGNFEDANNWFSRIILSKTAPSRLRERAKDQRDLVRMSLVKNKE